jgi:hypothetical protein
MDRQRSSAAVVGRVGGHGSFRPDSVPTRRKVEYWNCWGTPAGV